MIWEPLHNHVCENVVWKETAFPAGVMFHRVKKKLVLFRLGDHPSKQKPVSQKRNPKKSLGGKSCPNGCSLSQSLRCLLFQGGCDTNQCWRWALFTINNPLLSQHTLIAIIIIAPNGIGSMMIVVIFALLSAINRECGGKVNRGSELQQISWQHQARPC